MGTLFIPADKPEENYWQKQKQKLIDTSSFSSELSIQNNFYLWDKGLGCLV